MPEVSNVICIFWNLPACSDSLKFTVFPHEAAFSNLAGGALLWNDALTSSLLIGMWLSGAYWGVWLVVLRQMSFFRVWNVESAFRLQLPGCWRACSRLGFWGFFVCLFFLVGWALVARALLSHFTDISGSVYIFLVLWNLIPSVIFLHILFPGQQPDFWSQCASVFNPYTVTKMKEKKSINIDPEVLPLSFKADPKLINRNTDLWVIASDCSCPYGNFNLSKASTLLLQMC